MSVSSYCDGYRTIDDLYEVNGRGANVVITGRQAPFPADPVDAVVIALLRDINHDPCYLVEKEIVPTP